MEIDAYNVAKPKCVARIQRIGGWSGHAEVNITLTECARGRAAVLGQDVDFTDGTIFWSSQDNSTQCGLYVGSRMSADSGKNAALLTVYTNSVKEGHKFVCFRLKHVRPSSVNDATAVLNVVLRVFQK